VVKQTLIRGTFAIVLLLAPLAGCGGDGDDDADKQARPISGTFVGKIPDTEAFISVVATPAAEGQTRRVVTVFACDGRRLCEWLSGPAATNDFTVKSEDGDVEAKGKLTRKAVSGTIELPQGEPVRYKASQATATAGLYDLTVSAEGRLRGASAAGIALKGESSLPRPGRGTLRLADRTRLRFEVTRAPADLSVPLRAGQVRAIVLSGGELRGAGKSRQREGGGRSNFFLRSSK
jgi:hypothetical protein